MQQAVSQLSSSQLSNDTRWIDRFEKCDKLNQCWQFYKSNQQHFISGEKFGQSLEEEVRFKLL